MDKKILFSGILTLFSICYIFAQAGNDLITQDAKFKTILEEKRKINSSITVNDRYKIQIYTGSNDEAKKSLQSFKKQFKTIDGTVIYANPNYKVWVGSFKTRIEAERNYKMILKHFNTALIINPNK